MKRASFFLLLSGVLMLWARPTASAKSKTVRITVAGAGLANTIEVTDHQLLDISSWAGPSTDGAASQPEPGSRYYEVSFYFEDGAHGERKNYVVYYYPRPLNDRGIIYRPGQGIVWEMNTGSVLQEGKDGKWMYATSAWDAAWNATVSPAILSLKTGAGSPKTAVEIDSWTKPRPGWLYILDPQSEPSATGSRVWLVDPETAKVMGSIRAGYEPDFALSPEGSRLYITSGERESGELAVIDTASGAIRHVSFPDRVLYKAHYRWLPPFAGMMVAPDGRAVWIPGQHVFSPDRIESELSVFDTRSETFLATKVGLGNCGYGEFVVSPDPNQISVLCENFLSDSNRIRLVRLDAVHPEISNTADGLSWPNHCGPAEGFLSPDGKKMTIIRNDWAMFEMDLAAQKLKPTGAAEGDCGYWISHVQWLRSAEDARIYVGDGAYAPDNMSRARELFAFDTTTWKQLGRIRTSVPFWSAVASHDGKHVYAVAPAQHSVLVINAVTLQEERTISVGYRPALAMVAP